MTKNLLGQFDIICFSHLRWDFVYQRPQHLLSRFAKQGRVFFVEEPIYDATSSHYSLKQDPESNVWVFTPHLTNNTDVQKSQQLLLASLMKEASK